MPYKNLAQILTLAKASSEAGLEIDPFPTLKSQSNTHIAEFNADTARWIARLTSSIEKALTEQVREATTITANSGGTSVKGDKGDKGDAGPPGPPGVTGATGATGATENLDDLFENILTDGSNVLVGVDGNVLTGSL